MAALDFFCFGDGCAEADGEIVREMIAAYGNGAGVADYAAAVNDEFGRAAADVEKAAAEVAFVLREASLGRSERLKNGVADEDSRAICGGDEILRGGDRRGDEMDVGFEALADHADGVADAVLRVNHKFVREDVKDFAVFGKRDVAGGVDGAANVVAFDITRAVAKCDAAAAVNTANVAAGYADDGGLDRDVGDAFGFFDGTTNGADCGIKIDDESLAQTLGFGRAEREKFYLFAIDFSDQRGCFCAADVQPNNVTIFFCQAAALTLDQ